MRDVLVVTPKEHTDTSWNLDIDIIDGYPVLLPEASDTSDQRAALAAYQAKGTIPGMADTGIDWSQLYTKEKTLVNINDQIQKNIQDKVATATVSAMYIPLFKNVNKVEGLKISLLKAGMV